MTIAKYTLTAVNSKSDSSGNRYWGFRFTDLQTEKTVKGYISGGESNIYGILRYWDVKDDWDHSILFMHEEMKIREFDKEFKKLPYAGCLSEEIAAYIRKELNKE